MMVRLLSFTGQTLNNIHVLVYCSSGPPNPAVESSARMNMV